MSIVYTDKDEFVLFTHLKDPSNFKTGAICYDLVNEKVSKDDLARHICPPDYSHRFIKGDELQKMIDEGKIK